MVVTDLEQLKGDVYKRQYLHVPVLSCRWCFMSVSYTHLDVYKRQIVCGKRVTSEPTKEGKKERREGSKATSRL